MRTQIESNICTRVLAGLFAAGIVFAAAPAAAQDAAPAPDTAAEGHQDRLNEIVVTATKREQKLQDVPVSIAAIGGDDLQERQINDLRNLQAYVPNMAILNSGVNPVVYIRGFGSGPNNVAFDQEVSVYLDGIYGGRGAQFSAPFFDLERVEVLRGPQGALFGRNTAAGAISIISARPTKTFQGMLSAAYNFDRDGYEATGYVSGPLSDTLTARIAGKFVRQQGWLRNVATGKDDPRLDQELVRGILRWQPSADVDISLKGEYGRHQYWGGVSHSGSLTEPANFTDTRYVSNPYGAAPIPEQSGIKTGNVVLTANIAIGDHTLTSISGWSHFTTTRLSAYDEFSPDRTVPAGGANARYSNGFPEAFDQYSQEIRLASPTGGTFEYVVGGYFDTSDYHLHQDTYYQNIGAFTGHQSTDFDQASWSYSFFGQGTLRFADAFRAIAGLRYSDTVKHGDFTSRTVSGVQFNAIGAPQSGRLKEHYWDPSATLQFDASKDIMFYLTYGRGSKSGGFVSNTYGVTAAGFQFKPERSTNYEAGMKATLADGRATLNVSVFKTKFEDLQQSAYDPDRRTFFTRNAASASSTGVEAEAQVLVAKGLQLNASLAYLDAKFDDYPGAPCLSLETLAQCNSADPVSIAAHNIKGTPLQFAPKWSGNVGFRYDQDLTDDLKLLFSANTLFRSDYFIADGYNPIWGLQKGWAKIDGRIQIGGVDDKWNVALVGRNLTNKKTAGAAIRFPASITGVARAIYTMDEYRSLAVEGTIRF
ncbi:TonB-dependent receptor [Sphingomonas sp. HITSZ_GF]|uniref:TonB-dependent receptor n=1 Tax=Sphingomonas sp. HITSZ_GF TaxID=3037247 RepID=UPI00240D898C|nr:TonB-dependent receptor [Sphingomonas sp. HITSZ_GF]MDG2533889.1 TonB-dependent receptor [Sphingomonas sp. HITSZ_GF]